MSKRDFGHGTKALDVVEGLDLSGKTAIITGAASGLGVETARALASVGVRLVLPVRSVERGQKVADELKAETKNHSITVAQMDLIDYSSVRRFAKDFLADHDSFDILINNAGIMACPLARSKDGFESQFATNHLGHMLLTCLLVPALKKGTDPRVVALSSIGHRRSPVVFEDINFETREYDKWDAYGQAKTANALFAVELNRRLAPSGIEAFSVHPGGIMTNLQRDMSHDEINAMGWLDEDGNPIEGFKTPAGGAATAVWAATAPELKGRGGVYCEDCGIAGAFDEKKPFFGVASYAQDPEAAKELWAASEGMLNEEFDF
jgi:NAD(P)-dependent dehydrogenase (short-subunit alcohol dehydrogenase family)